MFDTIVSVVGKVRDALRSFSSESLKGYSNRDKVLIYSTIASTAWALFFGSAFLQTAVATGAVMALGVYLLLGLSERLVEFVIRGRFLVDGILSISCLVMPLWLGATIGLSVVFANLFVSFVLLMMWKAREKDTTSS